MKYLVCGFILFLSIQLASAQVSGFMVTGSVIDSATTKPIEFAAVTLTLQTDSAIISGGITDAEGKFTITVTNPGNYMRHYRFIGYSEANKNIEIKAGAPVVFAGKMFLSQKCHGFGRSEYHCGKIVFSKQHR